MHFRSSLGIAALATMALASLTMPSAQSALLAQQPAPTRTAGAVRALSLDEALTIAERESESIEMARAGVNRARGQRIQARSQYLPQLNGSLQYTHTLKSQFSALQTSAM